jgi:secondary thiamine-phosphate synthase enzyme
MLKTVDVKTKTRTEFINVTSKVQKVVNESGIKSGICYVYVPHTTAGVTINEGADPSVVKDIQNILSSLVPRNGGYAHMEGNSDAHIKASITGSSSGIIIEGGRIQLGTWQAIFFCEYDGPRNRKMMVKVLGDD